MRPVPRRAAEWYVAGDDRAAAPLQQVRKADPEIDRLLSVIYDGRPVRN